MKFKNIFIYTLLFVLAVGNTFGQDNSSKYVFVISKVNYLKAIDDAVAEAKNSGLDISEVRVILCGESVKALQEDNPIINKALKEERIKIFACGLSLDQMKVDASTLPDKVKTVRNGLLEAMILESKGYKKYDL